MKDYLSCRNYTVSDEVPEEFRPLMAAFMSYFLRANILKGKYNNKSGMVRKVEPMIWKLLVFIYELDDFRQKIWKNKNSKDGKSKRFSNNVRREMIRNLVRKKDGTFMSAMEQLEYFAEVASRHGHNIVCLLFKDKNTPPLKTREDRSNYFDVPVIQKADGRYAATSLNEVHGYILVQKSLREKFLQEKENPVNFACVKDEHFINKSF